MQNIFVLKLGSSTVLHGAQIYNQISALVEQGSKVIIVAGGAEAIHKTYDNLGLSEKYLTLRHGNTVRYTPGKDMSIIKSAYNSIIIPKIEDELSQRGISVFSQIAGKSQLTWGKLGKPLLANKNGRNIVIRDSLYGKFAGCDVKQISMLLNAFSVVLLTPPIFEKSVNDYISIDADMLAANLAIECNAAHLRFVTSTPGLLYNVNDVDSGIPDLYIKELTDTSFIKGKMKQKLRAVKRVMKHGRCDVAITGVHSLEHKTWVWNYHQADYYEQLFTNIVTIPSVSFDEHVLANYLNDLKMANITSNIDSAGNIVLKKGSGHKKLLLLGHIDTVRNFWQVKIEAGSLKGRGAVDAKAPFATFLSVLNKVKVPSDCQLIVIGAVEEESSSSKGAYQVRDNYEKMPVIIGEPSGIEKLTLGYNGLLKLKLNCHMVQGHSAGKGAISSIDALIDYSNKIREIMANYDPKGLSSIQDISHSKSDNQTELLLNFRVSRYVKSGYVEAIKKQTDKNISLEVLRDTPASTSKRSNQLANAFVSGFKVVQKMIPEYIVKTGTSDMNTLATQWTVPMVAYGPGDSTLDHTLQEEVPFADYHLGIQTLQEAIQTYLGKVTDNDK